MAERKKVQPKNPGAKATKATDSKSEATTTGHKTSGVRYTRKSGRKTSGANCRF